MEPEFAAVELSIDSSGEAAFSFTLSEMNSSFERLRLAKVI